MTHVPVPDPGQSGADGDATYLDKTLLHRPVELYFDESVTPRTLFQLWLRAALITGPLFFICAFILTFLSFANGLSGTESGSSSGSGGGTVILGLLMVVSVIGFWLILLATKLQEPISEWHVLLADRAPAAESAYNVIVGRARDRGLPLYPYTRRLPTSFGPVSNRLVLVDGHYEAYITVFAYGSGLYLGWTMWRSRRGAHLIGRYLADVFRNMGGQLDPVARMLRTEQARAMREAVHAVCREGLGVAIERTEVPDSYAFPHGLPPVETFAVSAPAPMSAPSPVLAAHDPAAVQNAWSQPQPNSTNPPAAQ
ncbi:MAG TPA: hypothetical protein VG247_10805 [Pseudonocardiaceae bacterium]|nr:hypothetical protein [Pseudonocardiaceae bacterium]